MKFNHSFLIILISIIFYQPLIAQNQRIKGVVLDEKTGEPLPFVHIQLEQAFGKALSNVEGEFEIKADVGDRMLFSFVGYEKKYVEIENGKYFYEVSLKESTTKLDAIFVFAGENPAHRIIRKVVENKKKNDPTKYAAYQYKSYNKIQISLEKSEDLDSLLLTKKRVRKKDSAALRLNSMFEDKYLFFSESITQKKFLYPSNNYEEILASRVSGYKDPWLTAVATDFQPFGFYRDFIPLMENRYLNPVSKGSTKRYEFVLEDSLVNATDTTYIISFEPKASKGFYGLKGLLYVSSNNYAIQNVIAETFDPNSLGTMKIEQQYEFIQNKWFPTQFNFNIRLGLPSIPQRVNYSGKNFFYDIDLSPPLTAKDFSQTTLSISDQAGKQEREFWQNNRQDSLDAKELNTYFYLDSIGEKYNLDRIMKLATAFQTQRLGVSKLEVMLDRLLTTNAYEGFAPGMGLQTKETFLKPFTLSAYGRYGLKDEAWKFGSNLRLDWNRRLNFYTTLSYEQELKEIGGRPVGNQYYSINQSLRNIIRNKVDSVSRFTLITNIRPFSLPVNLFFLASQSKENPTYTYTYDSEEFSKGNSFYFTEFKLGISYRRGEKLLELGQKQLLYGFKSPMVNLQLTKGMPQLLNGDWDYWKVDFSFQHAFPLRGLGKSKLGIFGGWISGHVPYSRLYGGMGGGRDNIFLLDNSFQTMDLYEFTNSEYLNVFLQHNFGRLIHRAKYFRPELIFAQNIGYGTLKHKELHDLPLLRDMEKGYFESGLLLNNLIRLKYMNMFYFGLGGGAYFRYGEYAHDEFSENMVYKLTFNIGF
ncbi:DUF5686 family protein [Xanthovirga aplysinae]|uniref:DUF5686 family protein n=1 Tax=Xanthovirga aplysinae TaxID=2529853 RepID=UPI0012BBDACD|nr:DUF5686 family protein [Xanthovirga aplysinae]MTI32351.1 carboxypeptidase-like regulatory domain-containing protein [Xanthovirga aplysinae]